jgi:hypothetical protein
LEWIIGLVGGFIFGALSAVYRNSAIHLVEPCKTPNVCNDLGRAGQRSSKRESQRHHQKDTKPHKRDRDWIVGRNSEHLGHS